MNKKLIKGKVRDWKKMCKAWKKIKQQEINTFEKKINKK